MGNNGNQTTTEAEQRTYLELARDLARAEYERDAANERADVATNRASHLQHSLNLADNEYRRLNNQLTLALERADAAEAEARWLRSQSDKDERDAAVRRLELALARTQGLEERIHRQKRIITDQREQLAEREQSVKDMQGEIVRLDDALDEAGMDAREHERKLQAREEEARRWQNTAHRLAAELDKRPTEDDVEDLRIAVRNLQAELFAVYRGMGRV